MGWPVRTVFGAEIGYLTLIVTVTFEWLGRFWKKILFFFYESWLDYKSSPLLTSSKYKTSFSFHFIKIQKQTNKNKNNMLYFFQTHPVYIQTIFLKDINPAPHSTNLLTSRISSAIIDATQIINIQSFHAIRRKSPQINE